MDKYNEALEKAKAYDEALKLMRDCVPDEDGLVHVRPSDIFSELAESEDERIRKTLIENFKFFGGDDLETSKWGKDDDLLVTDIIAWLEKQGQKPAWTEADDEELENTINALKGAGKHGSFDWLSTVKWLLTIKQRIRE